MARKQRIHYEGALYHAMARGNNGEYVLKEDEDKWHYLDIVKKYKEKCGFKLYAYCIMDNHVHMLIEVKETELSRIMQGVQQVYTQHYNKKRNRTGHVFQQRYKAIVCNKEGYLLHLIKYIHYNPVKSKLEGELKYKFSSHKEYLQSKEGLVDTEEVLKIISKSKIRALKGYLEYMKEEIDDIEEQEYKIEEAQRCKLDKKEAHIKLEELIRKVTEQEELKLEDIRKKTKKREITDVRKAIIKMSEKKCKVTARELANSLNLDISVVSKIKNEDSRMTDGAKRIMDDYERIANWKA
ncbi:MAG TPA: transposase [Clostridiales bacterium]|nr:transposase [Clostridiales bacterium]